MKKELKYLAIQGQIGHTFRNPELLRQALTRKSYSEEKGGADNEVLEFIGDKVLDYAVIKYLTKKFGREENGQFICEKSEGELTKLKARMVKKENLARRIDELRFNEFLVANESDTDIGVLMQKSVKEDLFEAIIGAVAIDTNYDSDILQGVVEIMLKPDSLIDSRDDDYVSMIQEWEEKMNRTTPLFKYYDRPYEVSLYTPSNNIRQNVPYDEDISSLRFTCEMKLLNNLPIFEGYGKSKNEARMNTCKAGYEWLEKQGLLWSIQYEIEDPNWEEAINQLEILARRNYFPIPEYVFKEEHDENGNPIWTAECHIEGEEEFFIGESSSKKEAKKDAAFGMLLHVLGYEEEDEQNA